MAVMAAKRAIKVPKPRKRLIRALSLSLELSVPRVAIPNIAHRPTTANNINTVKPNSLM